MSIRHLDSLFDPASVAVIGASPRPASVGATVWRNLRSSTFSGPVLAVNLKHRQLDGETVHARVADLPVVPELAVICTPPATVPGLIEELGAAGTHAAIVVTAGLDATQKQAMLDAARPHLLRILGPNCIGLLSPYIGLNASFAHAQALPGELAFVSQSGALMTAMLDWAHGRGIGFSQFVSLGERSDVDFGDMLDYLASDAKTRAILLYIESIEEPRKFMSAARAAARNKPVIVVKAGRSSRGQAAAASHTGALAGSDLVFDAAIRRAGMLRVNTLQQLFTAAETLARFRGNRGEALVVLTNGGGAGVLAADAAEFMGVPMAELSSQTAARLDRHMPGTWSRANPVDIIGDAPAERYVNALEALLDEPGHAVFFIHAPTAIVPAADIAKALLPLARRTPQRLMSCWLGGAAIEEARDLFRGAGIACLATPEQGVRAFEMLQTYRRNQALLIETPPAGGSRKPPDVATARKVVAQVLANGRSMLTEPEAKAVLAAFDIPVTQTRSVAPDADAAVAAADAIGYPVVLKILSADITHKSDVGGVALNINSADEMRDCAEAMLHRIPRERPQARLDGFTVQQMVRRKHAQELIVGASIDPVFGPTILFGAGGVAVEVLADRAIALPPLNVPLARALVERTRVAKLLKGFRDTPAADEAAVHDVLVAVSQLLAEVPEVAELDINPLIVDEHGVIALDARIGVSAARPAGADKFAIRPYPAHLVETVQWRGRTLTLRPIRPEDELQHRRFLGRLDAEDIRLRVFYSRRSIEHSELARLTQIDYAREMAFIAVAPGPDGEEETLGVARALMDPDNIEAEFGIVIRSDQKSGGLGQLLMKKLIAYLKDHGTQVLMAVVLDENLGMRALAERLGFNEQRSREEPGVRVVKLRLDG